LARFQSCSALLALVWTHVYASACASDYYALRRLWLLILKITASHAAAQQGLATEQTGAPRNEPGANDG